jgi:hypothetical protein
MMAYSRCTKVARMYCNYNDSFENECYVTDFMVKAYVFYTENW